MNKTSLKIMLSSIGIAIILALMATATYAYFTLEIEGKGSNMIINTFNKNPNHEEAEIAYQLLMKWDKVLGLNLTHIKLEKLPLNIQKLTKKREKLRAQKNWPAADKLRLEIERHGYLIKDTPFCSWVKLTNKINY